MKNINMKKPLITENTGNIIILAALIVLLYLLVSIYFANHFFFNTLINGVDVSLKSHYDTADIFKKYVKDYSLLLIEKNGEIEEIKGQDIGMQYNEKSNISKIFSRNNSFIWIYSLFGEQKNYIDNLFIYNTDNLEIRINELNCLNTTVIEPQNVSFKYLNGSYEMVKEIYGNKIDRGKLFEEIKMSILRGETTLDLNEKLCYENPKFTLHCDKAYTAKNLLNKYVSARIIYLFDNEIELLDGDTINKWLSVNENLDVVISEIAIMKYVRDLGRKYDTVGSTRNFKTSIGKTIEVTGGIYGWKIDHAAESKALMGNIKNGEILEKEPIYAQRALPRDDEIGDTYVEINITRQRLWFYKDGRILTQGPVVTGDPNRGYSTVLGTYMLNYKEKNVIIRGPSYEAKITYWMPFFGNIGIHEASWRHSFGGSIYLGHGSHGCVNTPLYLAKTIFENINEGTPIICYEEAVTH